MVNIGEILTGLWEQSGFAALFSGFGEGGWQNLVMIIIAASYAYMVPKYPKAGGEFTFAKACFGKGAVQRGDLLRVLDVLGEKNDAAQGICFQGCS